MNKSATNINFELDTHLILSSELDFDHMFSFIDSDSWINIYIGGLKGLDLVQNTKFTLTNNELGRLPSLDQVVL
jgi:hypothetical protein